MLEIKKIKEIPHPTGVFFDVLWSEILKINFENVLSEMTTKKASNFYKRHPQAKAIGNLVLRKQWQWFLLKAWSVFIRIMAYQTTFEDGISREICFVFTNQKNEITRITERNKTVKYLCVQRILLSLLDRR